MTEIGNLYNYTKQFLSQLHFLVLPNKYHCNYILMQFGPVNPFRTQQMAAPRNMLSGYTEPAHINDFMFEQQRRTFATYGK